MKYVAYIRVSTEKQGRSGLGLNAQRGIILHNAGGDENIIAWYEEVHSGKNVNALPELQKAIAKVKEENAILIIAKTDRLRNTQQALNLVDELTPEHVLFCNVGKNADKFMLTLFFAFAEKERMEISIRTKAALAVLKARGVKLGVYTHKNFRTKEQIEIQKRRSIAGAAARREQSLNNRNNILSAGFAINLRNRGYSFLRIAQTLNLCGFCTMTGNKWRDGSVYKLIKRFLQNE